MIFKKIKVLSVTGIVLIYAHIPSSTSLFLTTACGQTARLNKRWSWATSSESDTWGNTIENTVIGVVESDKLLSYPQPDKGFPRILHFFVSDVLRMFNFLTVVRFPFAVDYRPQTNLISDNKVLDSRRLPWTCLNKIL